MNAELQIMKAREKFKIGDSALKIQRFGLAVGLALLMSGLCRPTRAADWYVATNGTGQGTNGWADATNSLQGAVDNPLVTNGVTIWVSNGVYGAGGITNNPAGSILTNRLAITKAITVRSKDNDPTNTIIKGAWDPAATNGPAAVRCVYMIAGSSLIGFTLTNGATLTSISYNMPGGGVYCPSTSPVISNCIITGNSAYSAGGGAYYGTLRNCTLAGNFAWVSGGGGAYNSVLTNCALIGNYVFYSGSIIGGGAAYSTLYNCTLTSNRAIVGNSHGGAAAQSALYNCILTGNSAVTRGGATFRCTPLYNCIVTGNSAGEGGGGVWGDSTGIQNLYSLYNCMLSGNSGGYGGGARYMSLYNCTVAGNSAATAGGGVSDCTMYNSVVYLNTAPSGSNWYGAVSFTNSCTASNVPGWAAGNIAADPVFINSGAGNYRLAARSSCVNAGTNYSWMTDSNDVRSKDLDGRQRLRYGVVDMGAYEHIRAGTIYGVR